MTTYPDHQGWYELPFTKIVTGDTSYFTAHTFCFNGTDVIGIPQQINVVAGIIDAGALLDIRIYDVDNLQTISEITGVTDAYPVVVMMPAPANMSGQMAIWEVQIKKQGAGPKEVAVASLCMRF